MCKLCFNEKNKIRNSGQHRKHLVLCFISIFKHRRSSEKHLLSFWMGLDQLQVPICQKQVQLQQEIRQISAMLGQFHIYMPNRQKLWIGGKCVWQKKRKKRRSFACLSQHEIPKYQTVAKKDVPNHWVFHFCFSFSALMDAVLWKSPLDEDWQMENNIVVPWIVLIQ